jgi:FMNH2-dependent dimethyl sulfone monooxygenase
MLTSNPLLNENGFRLGLFSINAEGGTAFTTVPNRWRAEWDEIAKLAQTADAAGLEFLLPIARWKGYGGATDVRGASFETLAHAAALAAITRRIAIFSTVHVPLVHPVFAAKALTTIDHVSHGRAGLNIVCGWNQDEFDMFGHRQLEHDDRYDQGLEWYSIVLRILEGGAPFDYDGRYYKLKQVVGSPPPVQRPRPVTLSAAFSPAGRRFAASTSDFLFTSLRSFDSAKPQIEEINRLAAEARRKVGGIDDDARRLPRNRRGGDALLSILRPGDGRQRGGRLPPKQEGSPLRQGGSWGCKTRTATLRRRHWQLPLNWRTGSDCSGNRQDARDGLFGGNAILRQLQ